MMDLPNLTILDVGHGNCAVLRDLKGVIIFDAGTGDTLSEFLEQSGIKEIANVLISHADDDHIGGLLSLYLDESIVVRKVHLNPDSKRRTRLWNELRIAAKYARDVKGTITNTQLTTSVSGQLNCGEISIEILAPSPQLAMSGVGGTDLRNKGLVANTMSVVVRLKKHDLPIVVLPGDMDALALENMLTDGVDVQAIILVFPHHGGGSNPRGMNTFAKSLCELVRPECVIFSIGRGKYDTPRHEIVDAVRKTSPGARILCTQLSEHCAKKLPAVSPKHLNALTAEGYPTRSCCAGTITIDLSKPRPVVMPKETEYRAFIKKIAPFALCLKRHRA